MNDGRSLNFTWLMAPIIAKRLVFASLLTLLSVNILCAEEPSQFTEWPGFLGLHREGKSSETGIITDWSDQKLPVLWQIESGDGYGIGSVASGRYYHFDSSNDQARLRCIDVANGKEVWRFEYQSDYEDMYGYDAGPRASPLIDENRVYIYGVEGMLHCLDAMAGKKLWSINTVEKFGVIQNFFGVGSSPIVHEHLLLVMVGGSPPESQSVPPGALDRVTSNGTGVIAFNKLTGEVAYRAIDDLASYSSIQLATKDDQTVAYAWMRGHLFGFDPSSGKERFRFPWRSRKLESVNAMTPVVGGNGDVFISDCYEKGGVLIRRTEDGQSKAIWSDDGKRSKSLKTHWNTPVLIDGYLYGCSGRHSSEAELRCVEMATGKVMWSKRGLERTTVTAIDGHLIVLGERGDLRLIKVTPASYEEITQWENGEPKIVLDYPAWAAPIVSEGRMYVRGKRQLICFGLTDSANAISDPNGSSLDRFDLSR